MAPVILDRLFGGFWSRGECHGGRRATLEMRVKEEVRAVDANHHAIALKEQFAFGGQSEADMIRSSQPWPTSIPGKDFCASACGG